jgi:TRAP-type mannitol/chloroaromatic compound transport system permease small subunit
MPKTINVYIAAVTNLNRGAGYLARVMVFLAIVICFGNAVSRKAFDLSSNAYLEIQWYLFGAAFLFAAADTLRANAHVRIDVLANRLSLKTRLTIDIIGFGVFLLPFCLLMVYFSWPMVAESFYRNEMSSDAGGLLRWPVKLCIPVGFFLLGLQSSTEILKSVIQLKNAAPHHSEARHG